MYNGVGLPTPRGSGTDGRMQINKFSMKRKAGKIGSSLVGIDGAAGIAKKPSEEILEHNRKRALHLKLVLLEEKLVEQGYTEAEVAEKLEEARKSLGAAASVSEEETSDFTQPSN